MERYDTRIEDDTLYLESGEGDLEIGPMAVITERLGETYTIEYDEKAQAVGWLQTDEDGTITFDVRETIEAYHFDEKFARKIAGESIERTTPEGHPERTVAFADLVQEIWDSKGNVELD